MERPETLLACPFCGGEAEIKRRGSNLCSSLVGCTECHAELEADENDWTTGQSWNERAGGGRAPSDSGGSQSDAVSGSANCGAELLIHADDPYCFTQFNCELQKGHQGSHVAHFEKAGEGQERGLSNLAVEAHGIVSWQDSPNPAICSAEEAKE